MTPRYAGRKSATRPLLPISTFAGAICVDQIWNGSVMRAWRNLPEALMPWWLAGISSIRRAVATYACPYDVYCGSHIMRFRGAPVLGWVNPRRWAEACENDRPPPGQREAGSRVHNVHSNHLFNASHSCPFLASISVQAR